jgi:hypothetical protein
MSQVNHRASDFCRSCFRTAKERGFRNLASSRLGVSFSARYDRFLDCGLGAWIFSSLVTNACRFALARA